MTMQPRNQLNQPGALAQRGATFSHVEGVELHDFDLRPPMLVLVQAQSAEGTPGKLRRPDTSEEFDSLDVVALRVQKTRTKWAAGSFSRDRKPECISYDDRNAALTLGSGEPARFPGALCATCEFRADKPWEVNATDGWCMPNYAALVMDVSTQEVVAMRLNSTLARVAKLFGAAPNIRRTMFRLTPVETTNSKGKFYTLNVKIAGKLDADIAALADDLYREYGQTSVREAMERDAEQHEELRSDTGTSTGTGTSTPAPAQSRVQSTPPRRAKSDEELAGVVKYEPELRYTSANKAVCAFKVQSGDVLASCVAWESMAEDLIAHVSVGESVHLSGYWRDRTYKASDGSPRTVKEFTVKTWEITASQEDEDERLPWPTDSGMPGPESVGGWAGEQASVHEELPF